MKQPVLRLAQVTDIHIGVDSDVHQNADMRRQFCQVLDVLRQYPLDALILSGDLALNHGEIEAYQWLQRQLETFPIPCIYMMGNHDLLETMQAVFPIPAADIHNKQLYFSREIAGYQLLFLDSGSYVVSDEQLDWLQQQVTAKPTLLFIHHPPLLCGHRFMDHRHALRNHEQVWESLRQIPQIQHIFCGHYHTERSVQRDGKTVYVTPSTMLQIEPRASNFHIAHSHPGWRWIEYDGESLQTWVEYVFE